MTPILKYGFCQILPNQTFQTKPTKLNLPNQTYQTKYQNKPAKANLSNQTKPSQPSLLNQIYQTKITG